MKRRQGIWVAVALACPLVLGNVVLADTFGIGANQFEIDFVTISGDNGDLGSWPAGDDYTFSGVNHGNYRVGVHEITNDQWDKFVAAYGTVTGSPLTAYDEVAGWTGTNVPTTDVCSYEAAQYANWLNTSTSHQAAYKFTGTQGQSDYTFVPWDIGDVGYDASNPYRNSEAFYFLPSEAEWVKAAYWNGTNLQTYATKDDSMPLAGVHTNYDQDNPYDGPWDVGSGSEELNGTFDMMGNVWEWMESPHSIGDYSSGSNRVLRGGSYDNHDIDVLRSSYRYSSTPYPEVPRLGFRVGSVPEPCSLSLLAFSALALRRRRKR